MVSRLANEITSHTEPVENALQMAKSTAFKAAGFGAIGALQFLTEPKIN